MLLQGKTQSSFQSLPRTPSPLPSALAPSVSTSTIFFIKKKKAKHFLEPIFLSAAGDVQGMGLTHSFLSSLDPILTAVVSEIILHLHLGLGNQSTPQHRSPRTDSLGQWSPPSHISSLSQLSGTNAASTFFVLNLHIHVYASISQVTVPEILASK